MADIKIQDIYKDFDFSADISANNLSQKEVMQMVNNGSFDAASQKDLAQMVSGGSFDVKNQKDLAQMVNGGSFDAANQKDLTQMVNSGSFDAPNQKDLAQMVKQTEASKEQKDLIAAFDSKTKAVEAKSKSEVIANNDVTAKLKEQKDLAQVANQSSAFASGTIKISVPDVPANANKLAITIPSTINARNLRCDSKGDQYAKAIFNNGSGQYDRLKTSFNNLATICNKALNNKNIDTTSIKSDLKDAKKRALNQKQACEARKFDMQKLYSQTKDIFAALKQ
jgi:hypothetical protein